jgi:hypothetical protein
LAADSAIKVRLVDLGGLVLPPSSPAELGKPISDGQIDFPVEPINDYNRRILRRALWIN